MMSSTLVDFSYYGVSDGLLRVASIDLANGNVSNISVPVSVSAEVFTPGAKMADGRYVFPDTSLGSSIFAIQVLSADRTVWTQVATDNDQTNINNNTYSVVPVDSTEVSIFFPTVHPIRLPGSFFVDIDTGITRAFVVNWFNNPGDEIDYYESASLIDGTTFMLATTEAQYLYLVDAGTAINIPGITNGTWIDTGASPDFDFTAAAYNPARTSVFVTALLPFSTPKLLYVREYSYPTGLLLNTWGGFDSTAISSDANGVVSGDGLYYGMGGEAVLGSATTIGSFNISTGQFVEYSVANSRHIRVIPNSWYPEQTAGLATPRGGESIFYQRFTASSG